jgi:hypothetical protein
LPASGPAIRVVRERTAKTVRPGSAETVGPRKPDVVFNRETAAAYVGGYYSDELRALYEVVLSEGSLLLVHARHGRMRMIPIGEERFGVDGDVIVGASFSMQTGRAVGLQLEARSWGVTASFRRVKVD